MDEPCLPLITVTDQLALMRCAHERCEAKARALGELALAAWHQTIRGLIDALPGNGTSALELVIASSSARLTAAALRTEVLVGLGDLYRMLKAEAGATRCGAVLELSSQA